MKHHHHQAMKVSTKNETLCGEKLFELWSEHEYGWRDRQTRNRQPYIRDHTKCELSKELVSLFDLKGKYATASLLKSTNILNSRKATAKYC